MKLEPADQMDRGPAGALLRHHARARPDPRCRDRARRGRPYPRHQGRVPARHRRLRSVRPDRADQQPVHAARPLRRAELRQHVHRGLHQQADRHAVSRRRPPARRVRDRAAARHRRARTRASIAPRSAGAISFRRMRSRTTTRSSIRISRRSPTTAATTSRCSTRRWTRSATRHSVARSSRGCARKAAMSASASPAMSRAPASGPMKAPRCRCRSNGKVSVATGIGTQGQGHFTVFAQIVADQLGVDVARRRRRHRRHRSVLLGRRHLREPRRGGRRQRRQRGREGGAEEDPEARGRAFRMRRGRPRDRRRRGLDRRRARTMRSSSASSRCRANPMRGAVAARHRARARSDAATSVRRSGATASGVHAMIVEVDPRDVDAEDPANTSSCTTAAP